MFKKCPYILYSKMTLRDFLTTDAWDQHKSIKLEFLGTGSVFLVVFQIIIMTARDGNLESEFDK